MRRKYISEDRIRLCPERLAEEDRWRTFSSINPVVDDCLNVRPLHKIDGIEEGALTERIVICTATRWFRGQVRSTETCGEVSVRN